MRKNVKHLMIERDLSYKTMGELLGYTPQYIGRIANGQSDGTYKFWQTFKEKLNIPDCDMEKYRTKEHNNIG